MAQKSRSRIPLKPLLPPPVALAMTLLQQRGGDRRVKATMATSLMAMSLIGTSLIAMSVTTSVVQGQAADSARYATIDAYAMAALRADRVPGAAWAVVHGDSIVHICGFGSTTDGRAITGDTPFVIGSMSKPFTALAIMQLVEQGRVDLDAPAQRYLPWFRVADSVASRTITVRHLLLHTSGIPRAADRATGDDRTLVAHVRALQDVSLSNVPGKVHEYASPNYLVLGAIVETVTGVPFATHVQREIFAPLGMSHSFTAQDAAMADGMATGHRYWFGFPRAANLPHEHDRLPTAALISSAGDLARFMIAQRIGVLRDAPVLSSEGLLAMQSGGINAEGFAYGLGWRISQLHGVRAVHHGGIVPNFRGKMVMLPDSGWGVVVLTNASTSLPVPLTPTSHRIADAIAASLVGVPLDSDGSRFRMVYWGILAGTLLIALGQLRSLFRLYRSRSPRPPRGSTIRAVLFDAAWVLFAALWLPGVAGITWPEMFRGTPDMAWWLVLTLGLSTATVVVRAREMFRQSAAG